MTNSFGDIFTTRTYYRVKGVLTLQFRPPQAQGISTTDRELKLIAALAQIGLIRTPREGYNPPAVTGTLAKL